MYGVNELYAAIAGEQSSENPPKRDTSSSNKRRKRNTFTAVPANFTQLPLETLDRTTPDPGSIIEGFDAGGTTSDLKDKTNDALEKMKNNETVKASNKKVSDVVDQIQNNKNVINAKQKVSDAVDKLQNNQNVINAKQKVSDAYNKAKDAASPYLSKAGDVASDFSNEFSSMGVGADGKVDSNQLKAQLKGIFRKLLGYIEQGFVYVLPMATYAIDRITKALNLNSNDNTYEVIKRNIIKFFSIFISLWITYNLYYLMFCKPDRFQFTLNNIQEFSPMIHFFLKYNLVPMVSLDYLLFDLFPYYTKGVLGIVFSFYLLWLIVFTQVMPSMDKILSALLNSLHMDAGEYNGPLTGMMIMFGLLSTVMAAPMMEKLQRLIQYMYSPISTLVTFILRIVLLSIPFTWVGVLVTCLYLIYIFFFAIIANEGYGSYRAWKNVDDFINAGFGHHDPCDVEPPPSNPENVNDRKSRKEFRPYNCNECGYSGSMVFWVISQLYKTGKFWILFKLKHKLTFVLFIGLFYMLGDFLYSIRGDSLTQTVLVIVTILVGIAAFLPVFFDYVRLKEAGEMMASSGEKQARAEAQCSDIKMDLAFNLDFLKHLANPFDKLKEFGLNNFGFNMNNGVSEAIEHVAEAIRNSPRSGDQSELETGLAEGLKEVLATSADPNPKVRVIV